MEHYLDNSATTKVSQKAAEKAFEIMTENYGNPSSLHLRGMYAEQELVKARKEVARKLGAVVFLVWNDIVEVFLLLIFILRLNQK